MDIEYLLLLQRFRELTNDLLTPFMEAVSLFAVTYLMIVPAFIYWSVNKRSGLFTLASYTACIAFNAIVKLTCCIYRPWIRDVRVVPAGDAIRTATGYSFPSGHTASATPIYGGLGLRVKERMRWLAGVCAVCILVTGFSRNYLGVHTPQDVVVALSLGLLSLGCMNWVFRYLDEHPEKRMIFLTAGILFSICGLVYITFKQYPMEYVEGELLVDPQKMMRDGYGDIGMFMALCLGRIVEERWIRFETDAGKDDIILGIVGSIILFFLIELLAAPMKDLLGLHWGKFTEKFIITIFVMDVWPAIMKAILKKDTKVQE